MAKTSSYPRVRTFLHRRFIGTKSMRGEKHKLSLLRFALQEDSRLDGLSLSSSSLPTPKARNTKTAEWARDRVFFNRSSRKYNIWTIETKYASMFRYQSVRVCIYVSENIKCTECTYFTSNVLLHVPKWHIFERFNLIVSLKPSYLFLLFFIYFKICDLGLVMRYLYDILYANIGSRALSLSYKFLSNRLQFFQRKFMNTFH